MLLEELVCPRCYQRLSRDVDAWSCLKCKALYPVCDRDLPILVSSDPQMAIAQAYCWIQEETKQTRKMIDKLESEVWASEAWNRNRQNLIQAHNHNLAILDKIDAKLKPVVSCSDLFRALKDQSRGSEYWDFSTYLDRDWSWKEGHEEQIRIIEQEIKAALNKGGACFDSAAVLGAGMGRLAHDCSKLFDRVLALDLSITMALMYRLLRSEPLSYYYINQNNSLTTAEQVRRVEVSRRVGDVQDGDREPLSYIVADARRLPIDAESLSAVLSIFFSDMTPIRELLWEVNRVLAIGGVFVHFGPLHYHFDDPRNMLSAEEVRNAFSQNGFDIVYEQWVSTAQHRLPPSNLLVYGFRNWCFAARKRARVLLSRDSIVRINDGTVIERTSEYQNSAWSLGGGTVISPWGGRIQISELYLLILDRLDGKRSLNDAVTAVHYDPAQTEMSEIVETLSELQRCGMLIKVS
jgi:carnosine N-methyltransferase